MPSTIAQTVNAAAHAGGTHSWMAPDAKKLNLLYVSDYQTDDVYAYSYPQAKLRGVLAGILKGFVYPSGLCADASGDVFVPDSSNATVLEFAHGSTKLVATLADPGEYPYSCAVDPASGDLAVVNLESVNGAGGVSVYAGARGRPKEYTFGFVYKYFFDAYDGRGNLFVDAAFDAASDPFAFLELRKGGHSLSEISLDQSFQVPGGVGWDGKHVAVGDSKSSVIYRFDIAGSAGTRIGSARLRQGRFVTQFFIVARNLVGANFKGSSAMFWSYPAGGAPTTTIGGLGEPFGVTLSKRRR